MIYRFEFLSVERFIFFFLLVLNFHVRILQAQVTALSKKTSSAMRWDIRIIYWLLTVYISGNQSTIQLLRGFNVAETKENNEQFVAEYWNLILPGLSTLRSYLPKVSMSSKEHRKDVINVLNGYLKSLQIQEKLKGGIAFDETQIYEGLILTNDNVLVGFIEPINLIDLKKFDTSSLSATSAKNSTLNGKKPLPKTAKQSLHFVLVINSMKFALPIAYWFTQVYFIFFFFQNSKIFKIDCIFYVW